jgi:hypothetical protein
VESALCLLPCVPSCRSERPPMAAARALIAPNLPNNKGLAAVKNHSLRQEAWTMLKRENAIALANWVTDAINRRREDLQVGEVSYLLEDRHGEWVITFFSQICGEEVRATLYISRATKVWFGEAEYFAWHAPYLKRIRDKIPALITALFFRHYLWEYIYRVDGLRAYSRIAIHRPSPCCQLTVAHGRSTLALVLMEVPIDLSRVSFKIAPDYPSALTGVSSWVEVKDLANLLKGLRGVFLSALL